MANASPSLEFTGGQSETVTRLAMMTKGAGVVLLLWGGINVIGGGVTLLAGSPSGVLAIIEGLLTCLLGLVVLSASADVRFMTQTKFTSIHLGNAIQDLTVYYKVQFFLAIFLIAVAAVRLIVG